MMIDTSSDFLRPVVKTWTERINLAIEHRKPFDEVAAQCMNFFAGSVGWMYEEMYRKKYTKGRYSPKFQVTLNKAFELVALFGPVLYHRNPIRTVKPYEPVRFGPEVFGDPNDPNVNAIWQELSRQQEIDYARSKVRCGLLETYLSYTPREQPGGGLEQAAEDAITEALIKGGGVIWPMAYKCPASGRTLTGCFYDSIDNLLIDPDAESLEEARWIAKKCVAPYWQVEREFKLPKGTLKNKATDESVSAQSERRASDLGAGGKRIFDLITYWKVWSKAGVMRSQSEGPDTMDAGLADMLDEVVGDFAYMVICPQVPYPLNAPVQQVRDGDNETVKKLFEWPVPYWADNRLVDGGTVGRWPMALLGFYRKPRCAYPIAPLAPALGELTIINLMISALVNRVWNGSRTFIAVLKSAAASVKSKIENGEDLAIIELDQIHRDIHQVVTFLEQPDVSKDMTSVIEFMMGLFDKRTGLTDLLYGLNPGNVASRSATDIEAKRDQLSIRPDQMAKKVERWLTEAAGMEKVCAYWARVSGQDILPLVGRSGAYLWDQLIADEDPDVVFHEMYCTVESNSARRPNKDRDIGNMNQLFAPLLAELSKQADATGDTKPINAWIEKMGRVIEQPLDDIQMGPRVPPDSGQGQQEADQQSQAAQLEQQAQAMDMQQKAQSHAQGMQQSAEEHNQKMRQEKEQAAQKLAVANAQARMARIKASSQKKETA